ncbi:thiamine biosynthesis protein [Candidatus Magnetobacterium bavaricum]|uniref:Thiamine biosynthesis protein n=1 Tax=Candidatus Magnetobacterium bavaricum TaxID=29290 RepID=A0A0F3GRC9_9BACT|nr:thiamine biosynthesis protein [Candidatus Magnetobacterium bavaricum]
MVRAIVLYSGGLDSTLAAIVMVELGVDVIAVRFLTHFGCDGTDNAAYLNDDIPHAEQFGFKIRFCHLGRPFVDLVKNPKYGYGKNMNPCVDCRILMLKEAKRLMALVGADFLVTGEVIGQRPMSQRRDSFPVIDREAGVEGLVLRPLCARHLKPTIPEVAGLIDRKQLYGFNGRTRKPQMGLVASLGLTDYPVPAGGCLLTDAIYSYRLRELLAHDPDPSMRDIHLLRVGRHFRLSETCKAIVGRNEADNAFIETQLTDNDITMQVLSTGSPITLITTKDAGVDDALLRTVASLTARYSGKKHKDMIDVSVFRGIDNLTAIKIVPPASEERLKALRIEEQGAKGNIKPVRV